MTVINLVGNQLTGHLPSILSVSLPNLKWLALGMNKLIGTIPNSITNASELTLLELGKNSFSGLVPNTFGNLRFLSLLDLGNNYLTTRSSTTEWSFLSSLTNCIYLKVLGLHSNQLSGILPPLIGNFSDSLQQFYAYDCELKGSIPQEIGNLNGLIDLRLQDNDLNGTIPTTVGRLQQLQAPVKLDRGNYIMWKAQVLPTIRGNGLENFIDGTSPDAIVLKMQLHGARKDTQTITEFCTKVRNLANELQMAGKPVSEEDLCSHVLTGLSQSFESVVVNLTSRLHELTFDEMYSVLLNHEARLEQNATHDNNFEANMASRQGRNNWTQKRNERPRNQPPNQYLSPQNQYFRPPNNGIDIGGLFQIVGSQEYVSLRKGCAADRVYKSESLFASISEASVLESVDESLSPKPSSGSINQLDMLHRRSSKVIGNNTWELVKIQEGTKVIGNKWVYKVKHNPDGTVARHKARLVAKSYNQIVGVDYTETFSPVAKSSTIKVLLSLAINYGWDIKQVDVNNAFLNGELNETVFMEQPEGFKVKGKENYVCRLKKALYGLKQAPRAWYEKLKAALLSWGYKNSVSDTSLFHWRDNKEVIYVLVYVDDILITGSSQDLVNDLIKKLNESFALKELGSLSYFLGIKTEEEEGGQLFEDKTLYRSFIGALQYATITRPDIAYSVNKLSQFMQEPKVIHWQGCKRILRYLQGTLNYGMYFTPGNKMEISAFTDADWGADRDDRKSTGSFGIVYKGILSDGNNVAIKVFKLQLGRAFRSFDSECEVLRNVRHRNLLKILSSYSNPDFKALVLELMPNGSLENWLYSHNYFLDTLERLNIMIDVWLALEYLHHGHSSAPIVHCDLKPSNILLDENMVARVSDFGISKLLGDGEDSVTQTMTMATIGYMAPVSQLFDILKPKNAEFGSEGIISAKCDVYSFGVLLMETFTGKKPTDEMFTGEISLKNWVNESLPHALTDVVDANLVREEQAFYAKMDCLLSIMHLALDCCMESPEQRVSMKDVAAKLKKIRVKFLYDVAATS
ncbi:hypothetical protein KPL71_007491 [Citrus sinensis]|uniref:Uncharacterized protein n=1 Tax=Citrus sinensis TaxID=2711 RepID=A0ACB8LZW7_CITSI|nr:hypothetical protein KPL71_007491 [Citrus sinensis]